MVICDVSLELFQYQAARLAAVQAKVGVLTMKTLLPTVEILMTAPPLETHLQWDLM